MTTRARRYKNAGYTWHKSMRYFLCHYCNKPATGRDHRPPRDMAGMLPKDQSFIVRCCQNCNSKLGALALSLQDAEVYLRDVK